MRKAEVGDNERRTRLQAATDLSQRATALFGLDEMQGQETRPCIERTIRRAIDEPMMESCARGNWLQCHLCQTEHLGGWIDPVEGPAGPSFGERNEGVRLGLYFQRKAATVKSPLDILADKAIYQVVRTALGLPDTVAQASLDTQEAMIKKGIDVADFQDPKKVEKFLARFAAMYDAGNNAATASSPALAVLGLGDDTTTAGTDQGLLASMQRLNFRN